MLFVVQLAFGADHYVIPGLATGTHSGANCTNAYSGIGASGGQISPAAMTRGDTYWLFAGSYGSPNFSTTISGSSVITLEWASSSVHGSAGDCPGSGSYGQVVFGPNTAITTGFWTVNGQSWPAGCSGLSSCGVTGYNIWFHNSTDHQGFALQTGPGSTITLKYVEISGPYTITDWPNNIGVANGTTIINYGDVGLTTPGGVSTTDNLYVGYTYIHDVGVDLVASNNQIAGTNQNGDNHIYEHDYFSRDWYTCTDSGTCNHSQSMSMCVGTLIVRYNTYLDSVQDGMIDVNVVATCPIGNWDIYGNTIEWDNNIPTARQANTNGFLGFFGQTIAAGKHVNVYNNTMAGVGGYQPSGVAAPAWVCWSPGVGSTNAGSVSIENNVVWNSGNSGGNSFSDVGCGSIPNTSTVDYNQGFCPGTGCTNGAGYTPTGAHSLNSNTGNPFVNWDGTSNLNVSLSANTSAGLAITGWTTAPSGCTGGTNCENIDPFGVTRGANGTIDRGAFQIPSFSNQVKGLFLLR